MDIQTIKWDAEQGWSATLPETEDRETLVLVFADPAIREHPDRPLDDLIERVRGAAILGCSTVGQVDQSVVADHSIVATIVRFDHTRLITASVDVASAGGARRAGRQLGAALGDPALRGVLVVSDGLTVNGTALAAGISEELPGVSISGGLAGDGERFAQTWVIADGEVRTGWVTAVGFVGHHVEFGFGSAGGWDIFGPDRVVTRSHGNIVYELDSRPALALYREYLGEHAAGLPGTAQHFPLLVRDFEDRAIVRTVLAVDETTQSLHFGGDISQGSIAQLMRARSDRLIEGAHRAAVQAVTGREELAIAISCFGRRVVLGQRIDEELEATIEALQIGTTLTGFYSYGELSPTNGLCDLHNQTMTITTISELAA